MTQNESLIDTSLVRPIFRRGSRVDHSQIVAATSYVSMTPGAVDEGAGWNTRRRYHRFAGWDWSSCSLPVVR